MSARPFVLLALLTTILLPAADAQVVSASGSLLIAPIAALSPGETAGAPARFSGTMDATAVTSLSGVPVQYSVAHKPDWAVVTLSPQSDVIPVRPESMDGASFAFTRTFAVNVTALANLTGDRTDVLEIVALTLPGVLARPVFARATITLHGVGPAEAPTCDEGAATPTVTRASEGGTAAPEPLHVQSAAVGLPTTSIAVAAGLGAVGAGVGLLLRRRF